MSALPVTVLLLMGGVTLTPSVRCTASGHGLDQARNRSAVDKKIRTSGVAIDTAVWIAWFGPRISSLDSSAGLIGGAEIFGDTPAPRDERSGAHGKSFCKSIFDTYAEQMLQRSSMLKPPSRCRNGLALRCLHSTRIERV